MKFNKYSKLAIMKLARKVFGVDLKLPKGELEQIEFIWTIVQQESEDDQFEFKEWLNINSILLLSLWFSDHDFPNEKYIVPQKNIIRYFELGYDIEEFLVPGVSVKDCYVGLIRDYIEDPHYSSEEIESLLKQLEAHLDDSERLAVFDERLYWKAERGLFNNIDEDINILLSLEKGNESDCYACIMNRLVTYSILSNKAEWGFKLIDEIISQKLTCDGIPLKTNIQKIYLKDSSDISSKELNKYVKKVVPNSNFLFEASLLLKMIRQSGNDGLSNIIREKFDKIALSKPLSDSIYYCIEAYNSSTDLKYYNRALNLANSHDIRNGNNYYNTFIKNYIMIDN